VASPLKEDIQFTLIPIPYVDLFDIGDSGSGYQTKQGSLMGHRRSYKCILEQNGISMASVPEGYLRLFGHL
jgi:hypothetical protein